MIDPRIWGEISVGSVFIADAHEGERRRALEELWGILEKEASDAPIFLMGDMFDLLCGGVRGSFSLHAPLLERMVALALRRPVYWLEGNHDFNLSGFLPHIHCIPRESQPALFLFEGKRVALAHGDLGVGFFYECYTHFIRNQWLLAALGWLDGAFGGRIYQGILNRVAAAPLKAWQGCAKEAFFRNRAAVYARKNQGEIFGVFEGHFHADVAIVQDGLHYRALPSLACHGDYFVVESDGFLSMRRLKN